MEEYSYVLEVSGKSSVTISNLLPGTKYAVAIQAKYGIDKFSSMVEFTTG